MEISKTGQKETQHTCNISKYAEINKLTGTMLNKLVEKIEVCEPAVFDGAKKQCIRIYIKTAPFSLKLSQTVQFAINYQFQFNLWVND